MPSTRLPICHVVVKSAPYMSEAVLTALLVFLLTDLSELTLNGSLEERAAFVNMVTCSQVHFK